MDRLLQMQVYVAVAEEEGFAAAARRLNMSPPAVTRAIAQLEYGLGVKLLNRSTRFVRVTEAGMRYLEDARRILLEVQLADESAAGINAEPRGHLTVTAPVLFGQKYVMPGIVDYLQRYPKTEVDAVFYDRVVNLLEEGLDVGIRIGALPDSTMRALPVGKVRLVLVASPAYLNAHGIPQTPQELDAHNIIHSRAGNLSKEWRFMKNEKPLLQKVKPRLTVTSNDAAMTAAKESFGICRLLSYQVADDLLTGRLKTVLENYELPALPVHIVHREGRLASAKVRAFIDLMAERLRADTALN
ncbi:MAG: DNA-binding transcriptional LysR family regulator [Paracoccaceae bacterium]